MRVATNCRCDKNIILSFDDGPNPYWTEKIIELLGSHGIKAVFFVLGERAVQHPELIRKIILEGHEIGNHTYDHKEGNFLMCDQYIYHHFGYKMNFLRPPYYDYSYLKKELASLNDYILLEGTVDTQDYLNISAERVKDNILRKLNGGGIITLHDGSDNFLELPNRAEKTFVALSQAIPILTKEYKFILPKEEDLTLQLLT